MLNKRFVFFIVLILVFIISLGLCLFYRLDFLNSDLILSYIRIPSVIKAIVSGACLALAGMLLQTISKNPLADPYLTGLSSGAGFGIVLSILFFQGLYYSIFGFFGALLVALIVIFLSGFSKFSITKLILIGLSINIFFGSLISFFIIKNPGNSYVMTLILTGGFSSSDISDKLLIILFAIALLFCAFFIPKLNAMRLDNRLVFKSDNEVYKYNIIIVIIAAFLTSLSVYSAGILGFVGIVCPLLSKLLIGNDARSLFFSNIFLGSSLLLFSHFLSVNLIYPLQIPLGIVISFIGAPIFIFFLLKKGGILNN